MTFSPSCSSVVSVEGETDGGVTDKNKLQEDSDPLSSELHAGKSKVLLYVDNHQASI